MDQINILFNDSNLYFLNPEILQTQVGFVNPMDIDIYVKKSFSVVYDQVTITGGYIQAFNKDHLVDEYFNCYKVQLSSGKPIHPSLGIIKFDLENGGRLGGGMVQSMIQSTPIISILLFTLLSFLFPPSIASVMRYISVFGIVFTILFFAYKLIRVFIRMLKSKGIDFNGVNITFENTADIFGIRPDYIETLKILWKDWKVQKIVLINGEFYLKQIIKRTSIWQTLRNVFVGQTIEDSEVQTKIQNTLNFMLSTSFISTYNNHNPGQQPS